MDISHVKYEFSLFGVELTADEQVEMMAMIERFAKEKRPEVPHVGTALWNYGEPQDPLKDFSPATLEGPLES